MAVRGLTFIGILLMVWTAVVPTIAAQEVTIPSQAMAGEELKLPGILHKPGGEGPFPAVVMLSGCAGYGSEPDAAQQSTWADRLVEWGYVALQVDSFGPRGYPNGVCHDTASVSTLARAHDAYTAKSYLSTLAFVDPKNVAVMGWSHGGSAVMSIIDAYGRDNKVSPFRAAVAFYPYCPPVFQPDTPVLVLTGKKDDWCPVSMAEMLKKRYEEKKWKPEFSLTVYPNATHAFDFETTPTGGVLGHHMEYDPEATSDAITLTRDFLAKHTGGR